MPVSPAKRPAAEISSTAAKKENRPAKRSMGLFDFDNLGSTMVTITVEEKVYTVHKSVICHRSPYFSAAFNGNYREAQTLSLTVQDSTKAAFTLFVAWIYSEKIVQREDVEFADYQHTLFELAILADRCLIPRLQNDAIMAIYNHCSSHQMMAVQVVQRTYQCTVAGSALRKLISVLAARCICFGRMAEYVETDPSGYPPEFVADMFLDLQNWVPRGAINQVDPKQFLVVDPEGNGEKAAGRKAR